MNTDKILPVMLFCLLAGWLPAQQGSSEKYVRLSLPEEYIPEAAPWLQEEHSYRDQDKVVLEQPAAVLSHLDAAGIPYEVLIEDLTTYYQMRNEKSTSRSRTAVCENGKTRTPENFKLGSMGGYLTLEEMEAELNRMHQQYPRLISAPAGISDFKTYEGRPVLFAEITAQKSTAEKKNVLYTGLHHAREPISMQQLMYYMWYLLENYGSDATVTEILDHTRLYFIPCVNPDGYAYNALKSPDGGGMWRKNRRPHANGHYGVDLNRNYGYQWGYDNSSSENDPGSETYRGPEAFSEPETRAVKWFCENHEIYAALNYHAYGDYLIYPWGYKNEPAEEVKYFEALARSLSFEKRILTGTSVETVMYGTNGDADDWMYGERNTKNKIYSMTPEVGPGPGIGFWPPENKIRMLCDRELDQNLRLALSAHQFVHLVHSNEPVISDETFEHSFYLYPLSMSETAVQTHFTPVTKNIRHMAGSLYFIGPGSAEEFFTRVELEPGVQPGEEVVFVMTLDNGLISLNDTVRYIYNPNEYSLDVFNENGDLQSWVRSSESGRGWGATTREYYSPPSSVTDSPNGVYASSVTNSMYSKHGFQVPEEELVYLTFRSRWDITHGKDFARLSVSRDGEHYQPLCGHLTTPRFDYQGNQTPAFTGIQNEWLTEVILLDEYAGDEIYFKWEMISESVEARDGIYIDNMRIVSSAVMTASEGEIEKNVPVLYPNPVSGDVIRLQWPEGYTFAAVGMQYQVQDLFGRTLRHGRLNAVENTVPVSGLVPGMYILRVGFGNGEVGSTFQFVVGE